MGMPRKRAKKRVPGRQRVTNAERVGWPVIPWCTAAGISKATHYNLPVESAPKSVTVGKRRVIIESPADWLKRIAEAGGTTTTRAKSIAEAA